MSITTYAELQTAVADLLHRTDLTAKIPDFIALAEDVFQRELSISEMETVASGTTSSETITLPTGFGSVVRLQITLGGTRYSLDYTSPNGIEALTASTGHPTRYTVEEDAIRMIPAPAGGYSYDLFYTPTFTPLSDSDPTNWVLENAKDLYLYSAMVEACRYCQDDEGVSRYQGYTAALIDSIRRKDERRRLASAGGLQIKPRNAV
ncbi:MAG: hypothetical protein RJA34_1743 [Pseudomonadota bacterium]|jgi:hypothetical protein